MNNLDPSQKSEVAAVGFALFLELNENGIQQALAIVKDVCYNNLCVFVGQVRIDLTTPDLSQPNSPHLELSRTEGRNKDLFSDLI